MKKIRGRNNRNTPRVSNLNGRRKVMHRSRTRIAVLVDVQNLFHSAIALHDGKVDYGALLQAAADGRTVAKALAYVITTEQGKERNFCSALRHVGFEVKSRPLQVYNGGRHMKGNWDVGLALDAIDLVRDLAVKTVVIVSGDGDFIDLVNSLHRQGVTVEVMAFGRSTSGKLKAAADKFTDLSDNPERFILQSR